jgi:hypothetical protein
VSSKEQTKAVEQPQATPPAIPTGAGPTVAYEEFKLKSKKWYWLGTLPGGPVQAVSTSHCRFPGFIADRQTSINDGKIQMVERMGRIAEFSDDEVEQIKKELTYEFIATKAGRPIVVEDDMGVRSNFNHTVGKVWTQKDVNGTQTPFHRPEPWMEGSKPLAAFVYMIPLNTDDAAKAKALWPLLQEFIHVEKIIEGEGLVWSNLAQFKMDRMPQPVGRPAEAVKKTA